MQDDGLREKLLNATKDDDNDYKLKIIQGVGEVHNIFSVLHDGIT